MQRAYVDYKHGAAASEQRERGKKESVSHGGGQPRKIVIVTCVVRDSNRNSNCIVNPEFCFKLVIFGYFSGMSEKYPSKLGVDNPTV